MTTVWVKVHHKRPISRKLQISARQEANNIGNLANVSNRAASLHYTEKSGRISV